MSIREIKEIWRINTDDIPPCSCCGVECRLGEDHIYLGELGELVVICCPCSNVIMNVEHKAHSGEYIGWPNERENPAYVKKPIAHEKRWKVWERDNFTCKHCGSRRRLAVDHIFPEKHGGTDELYNLQTLCMSCNSKKGAGV